MRFAAHVFNKALFYLRKKARKKERKERQHHCPAINKLKKKKKKKPPEGLFVPMFPFQKKKRGLQWPARVGCTCVCTLWPVNVEVLPMAQAGLWGRSLQCKA